MKERKRLKQGSCHTTVSHQLFKTVIIDIVCIDILTTQSIMYALITPMNVSLRSTTQYPFVATYYESQLDRFLRDQFTNEVGDVWHIGYWSKSSVGLFSTVKLSAEV
jgi:hemoglobin-like flavoprotein